MKPNRQRTPDHGSARRLLLGYLAGIPAIGLPTSSALATEFPEVTEAKSLQFPRDHGAHPDFRTEWWYLTGWLDTGREPFGFQVTFFRSRTIHSQVNPSRFAPTQLLFAHVALADPQARSLEHDQRSARAGFNHASFSTETTDLQIGDWRLRQLDAQQYQCIVRAKGFSLQLDLQATQPIWLQGNRGHSRKGPLPPQASYYYSRPQMSVRAQLQTNAKSARPAPESPRRLNGVAWLDHEWSSQVLDPEASGWDWVGLNLNNGDALMAFRIRRATSTRATSPSGPTSPTGPTASTSPTGPSGSTNPIWQHARLRRADQSIQDFSDSVEFNARRWWRSTRTGVDYPVEMALRIGTRHLRLIPLFDDQELDSRQSTGTLYWEGAVTVLENGQIVGRGYLELTGYGDRLRL